MRDMKADKVGFEPTIRLPVYSISNAAPSTARTPVQWREHYSEEVQIDYCGGISLVFAAATGLGKIEALVSSGASLDMVEPGTPQDISVRLKI